MRLSKLFAVIVLVLFASGIALANGIDTQLNVNGGGGGSPVPPLSFAFSATTANGTGGFDGSIEFLPNYVIQSITMSMPVGDWTPPTVCLSNAYVVNGGLGTAPTSDGNGNLVCTFTLGTFDPNAPTESLFTMQTDCTNSNLGLISDFEDCVGVSPTSGQDIIYGIGNASVSGATASVVNTPVPEPGSFSLLFAGLFGLSFMRRKLGR